MESYHQGFRTFCMRHLANLFNYLTINVILHRFDESPWSSDYWFLLFTFCWCSWIMNIEKKWTQISEEASSPRYRKKQNPQRKLRVLLPDEDSKYCWLSISCNGSGIHLGIHAPMIICLNNDTWRNKINKKFEIEEIT